MRVPISYGLHYPDRVDVPVRPLDLVELGALTFEQVDVDTFACLRLAREAGLAGGTAPCTLNAANEVAVHAFMAGRLGFLDIAAVIEDTLAELPAELVHSFESLGEADADARRIAGRADRRPRGRLSRLASAGLLRNSYGGPATLVACPTSWRSWGSRR